MDDGCVLLRMQLFMLEGDLITGTVTAAECPAQHILSAAHLH